MASITLYDLLNALEKDGVKVDDKLMACGCDDHSAAAHGNVGRNVGRASPMQGPFLAFYFKLLQFLKDIALSDLVLPGRRIDVPLESLRWLDRKQAGTQITLKSRNRQRTAIVSQTIGISEITV